MADALLEEFAAWLCILAFILLAVCYAARKKKREEGAVPPSPPALPVIGHLHHLSHLPHRDLARLSIRYGPLFSLRLGSVNCVVVSSPQMAAQFLKTHDAVFASRPKYDAGKIIGYNYRNILSAPYGLHLRHMRKICIQELFTPKKLLDYKPIRVQEISLVLQSILTDCIARKTINLTSKLSHLASNVMTRITIGKKFFNEDSMKDTENFGEMARQASYLAGVFNIGDYLPFLSRLDIQGYKRRMEALHLKLDNFWQEILEEEMQKLKKESDSNNLVQVLLQIGEDEKGRKLEPATIKAVIEDVILGGSDTVSVTIEWAIAELLRSPKLMQRAQQEVDSVAGSKRLIEEEDIPKLPFLQAIVKETFRLHPAAPLLVPRESIEQCNVAGYNIPKGTRLIVNAWQMGRSREVWKDPDLFDPQRFMNSNIDVKGRDFELIPFGSGRRICPGMPHGLIMVHTVLAHLIHTFNLEAAQDLQLNEKFGLTSPMAKPLLVVATPRLF